MNQIPLLKSLPKPNRDINSRSGANRPELVAIAKQFGELYFDGPREFGCGVTVMTGVGSLSPGTL